jgi:hypothetical protein
LGFACWDYLVVVSFLTAVFCREESNVKGARLQAAATASKAKATLLAKTDAAHCDAAISSSGCGLLRGDSG